MTGLEQEEERPEPVVDEAKVAGIVGGLVVALVSLVLLIVRGQAGDLSALQLAVEGVVSAGMAAVALLAPVWRARKARRKTTPLESPRSAEGVPLVPIDEAQVVVAEKLVGHRGWVVRPQEDGKADHADPNDDRP